MSALQMRYAVTKINDPDGKHKDCRYFVLDPQHDLAARKALLEYARHSGGDLATELVEWVLKIEKDQKEQTMTERRRCEWCGKYRLQFSEWEQQAIGIDGKWMPLCRPCATSRLKNPFNVLLGMRKIGESK